MNENKKGLPKVILILPAYNEEANILRVVKGIESFKEENKDNLKYSLDYIVINDGSKDNTEQIAKDNNINIINLPNNLGIGGAVQTGYKYALKRNYDIAVQFDGDGQHDIDSLNNIVLPIINNEADFVVGSRFIEDDENNFKSTALRRFGIGILSSLIKLCTGKKIYDVTSGYRAANKKIIELFVQNYPIDYPEPESLVFLTKQDYKILEKHVNMLERKAGTSSIKTLDSAFYMVKVSIAILLEALG